MCEILAPCGSPDALRAAIAAGADAVYFGVGELNARAYARNISMDELSDAIALAHVHGVRAYLAVNTLIKQHEILHALELIDAAYEAGVDGIIVQDLGLLVLAHTRYPDMEIHASTQMTVHSTLGARLVAALGAGRVILARELSCSEVRRIAKEAGVDVEVFVHGALCYCYSGQCLFSSFVGGRSANRGRCAQPCRKRYTLVVDGREVSPSAIGGEYVLSTAELCLLDSLDRVLECHPKALKIEGRMRRSEYVACVVDAYRRALSGEDISPLMGRTSRVFYRGFTHGWFLGENVVFRRHSANIGLPIGRVEKVGEGMMEFVPSEDIEVGDGIGVHTAHGIVGSRIRGMYVKGRRVKRARAGERVRIPLKGCERGDEVYLTADASLVRELSTMHPPPVEVDVYVVARIGMPLVVRVSDGVHVGVGESEYVVERGVTSPTSHEQMRAIAARLGGTPYIARSISVEADEGVFVPLGSLSAARRRACEMLTTMRSQANRRTPPHQPMPTLRHVQHGRDGVMLSVAVGDASSARAACDCGADMVYVPLHIFEEVSSMDVPLGIRTPVITKDDELEKLGDMFVQLQGVHVCASNLGVVQLCAQHAVPFVAEESLNVFNPISCAVLAELGAVRVCASSELTIEELRELCASSPVPIEVKAHGYQRLMVSEHDLIGELVERGISEEGQTVFLKDERGYEFPVVREHGRTVVYNSIELCMLDRVHELVSCGARAIRLDLVLHTPEQVRNIVGAYRRALAGEPQGLEGRYTTGHYLRGVV